MPHCGSNWLPVGTVEEASLPLCMRCFTAVPSPGAGGGLTPDNSSRPHKSLIVCSTQSGPRPFIISPLGSTVTSNDLLGLIDLMPITEAIAAPQ